ncbi:Pkinase-domain-containing protein [Apiospora marii]|uniref:Pkinase-domain-containing protein n=1 Tax=Apiospora marii TaxID=335849 RepID=A0ABR1R2S1_9PEZI
MSLHLQYPPVARLANRNCQRDYQPMTSPISVPPPPNLRNWDSPNDQNNNENLISTPETTWSRWNYTLSVTDSSGERQQDLQQHLFVDNRNNTATRPTSPHLPHLQTFCQDASLADEPSTLLPILEQLFLFFPLVTYFKTASLETTSQLPETIAQSLFASPRTPHHQSPKTLHFLGSGSRGRRCLVHNIPQQPARARGRPPPAKTVLHHQPFRPLIQASEDDKDAPYTPPVKAGPGEASRFDRYLREEEEYGQETRASSVGTPKSRRKHAAKSGERYVPDTMPCPLSLGEVWTRSLAGQQPERSEPETASLSKGFLLSDHLSQEGGSIDTGFTYTCQAGNLWALSFTETEGGRNIWGKKTASTCLRVLLDSRRVRAISACRASLGPSEPSEPALGSSGGTRDLRAVQPVLGPSAHIEPKTGGHGA